MWGRWQPWLVILAVISVSASPTVAVDPGAFQLLDDQSSESMTPDTGFPCQTKAQKLAALAANGSIEGSAVASSEASGLGECDELSRGAATAQGKFQFVPDQGTAGDAVVLCARFRSLLQLSRTGAATATAEVHGSVVVNSSTVLRISNRSISVGGAGAGPDVKTDEFECVREFTAKIGDMFLVGAGTTAITKLGGDGVADAEGEVDLLVAQSPCPDEPLCPVESVNEAPVLSRGGIAAACVLLLLVGTGFIRRRSGCLGGGPAA